MWTGIAASCAMMAPSAAGACASLRTPSTSCVCPPQSHLWRPSCSAIASPRSATLLPPPARLSSCMISSPSQTETILDPEVPRDIASVTSSSRWLHQGKCVLFSALILTLRCNFLHPEIQSCRHLFSRSTICFPLHPKIQSISCSHAPATVSVSVAGQPDGDCSQRAWPECSLRPAHDPLAHRRGRAARPQHVHVDGINLRLR
jgi:hypothetical protein